MENLPNCPECKSEYSYENMGFYACPECGHEWAINSVEEEEFIVKDANGTILKSGDDVTIVKDLKIKGSSSTIKVGTKIKNIRLVESADDHNIDCKISGIGAIKIIPKFVKKS